MSGALAMGALFAATHPSRTAGLVVLESYANPMAERTTEGLATEQISNAMVAMWGTGEMPACPESGHAVERGDPGSLGTV